MTNNPLGSEYDTLTGNGTVQGKLEHGYRTSYYAIKAVGVPGETQIISAKTIDSSTSPDLDDWEIANGDLLVFDEGWKEVSRSDGSGNLILYKQVL